MDDLEYHDPKIHELETWKEIISSTGWDYFKEMLNDHKTYLEKQVLVYVGQGDMASAQKSLARADECSKILLLVGARLAELKTATKE